MEKENSDFWAEFWRSHKIDENVNPQIHVARTRNKNPITQDSWEFTLESVRNQLELNADDILLDLCCGNGLFTVPYSNVVTSVYCTDLNSNLLSQISSKNLSNVTTQLGDMREVSFATGEFSKVLWYAGIQYIDESDIVNMLFKIKEWLSPGGKLLIGDIPDRGKMWSFFNTSDRQVDYFSALGNRKPIIGSWIDRQWLEKLCVTVGFKEIQAIDQDPRLIYSDFRFDLIASI